jgi:cell division protein FtsB
MNNILILNPSSILRPFILRWRFSLKMVLISGIGLIILLLVVYLYQLNAVTQISFAAVNYEKQIEELAQENKNLEKSVSGLSSLASVETLIQSLDYEKVQQVYYLQMLDGTVVAK